MLHWYPMLEILMGHRAGTEITEENVLHGLDEVQ